MSQPWERRRRVAVPALAALAVAALVVLGIVLRDGSSAVTAIPVATVAPTTPAATVGPSPTGAPRSASPKPSATASPSARPLGPPSSSPSPAAVPVPLPTVQLLLQHTALMTSCGSPTTSVASVQATGWGVQTVVRWDGTSPGSKAFAGSGEATIGPYTSVADASGTDTVTVTATVTDSLGRVVTKSRTLTVTIAPC